MDSVTLLGTVAGGGFGYLAGIERGKKLAPDNSNEDVNVLSQQVLLLKTQIEAQKALIEALSTQSGLSEAVKEQLKATVQALEDKLAGSQVTLAGKFPVILGSGDPAQAGWVKGRDGLLVNRVLPNFISPDALIAVATGWTSARLTTGMAVADINNSLPARSVTIGVSMNTCLKMHLKNGIFPSMCVVLNFAEDVADDTDFICKGYMYDDWGIGVWCVPVGRNSLLLMPLIPSNLPANHSIQSWGQGNTRDHTARDDSAVITTPAKAQRASYTNGGMILNLGHRSARNLTLRSWNIVGHPFALWQETYDHDWDERRLSMTRRQGDTTVVQRLNSSVTPKFYRPNDNAAYDSVDLSSSVYL